MKPGLVRAQYSNLVLLPPSKLSQVFDWYFFAARWEGRVAAVFLGLGMKWQMILWWSTSKLLSQLPPPLRKSKFYQRPSKNKSATTGMLLAQWRTQPLGPFSRKSPRLPNSTLSLEQLHSWTRLTSGPASWSPIRFSFKPTSDRPLISVFYFRRASRATMTCWTRWGAEARQSKIFEEDWLLSDDIL